jgi:transposase
MTRTQRRHRRKFTTVNPDAAGIDIGSRFHVVAVPADRGEIRTFNTFTRDLYRLADWLDEAGIQTVAMESTGVYWIPLYEILEARGFEVLLVNARHVKHVPGRKTDVHDAQWLQQLHQFGLLSGSFRPHERLLALRTYLRERDMLISHMATHVRHMHKALTQMNLQIHHVIADITGVTGMAIVRAILDGERDPEVLAQHRDRRCKASEDTIREALVGNYRAEHVFSLQLAFELYQFHQQQLQSCDVQIQLALDTLQVDVTAPEQPLPAGGRESKQANAPKFPVRDALYALLGVDLTQIGGLGAYSALKLIGECGTDMSAWNNAKHFTSWLTLAPGSKKSGGKVLSSKTRTSSNRAAAMFRMAAMAVGRTDTALGAFYRRLAARKGKPAAITATARKIAVLFYNMLRYGLEYQDPGAEYYDQQHRQRVIKNLKRRAQSLGYELKLATTHDLAVPTS